MLKGIPGMAALVVAAALLAGCETMSMFEGDATPWDGRWTGRMTFSSGYANCPRRGSVQLEIANGKIDGRVRTQRTNFGLSGRVDQLGKIKNTFITQHNQRVIDLSGQFEGDDFSGRWEDLQQTCRGAWELRRS